MALGYFRHPRGGGGVYSKQSSFFFYVKQQNLQNKALIVDREDWKTDLLSLDPSCLEHLAKHSSQNLKTRSSIEGTAHSRGHNS